MKISFIIPCYNCQDTLPDTVKSILSLGLTDFEICMVDDCSKDGTYQLLQSYLDRYPQYVKIGHNEKNMGGGYTRNMCAKLAHYEWYFLIDSDNYLDKKSFLKLLSSVDDSDNIVTFQQISFFYDLWKFDLVYKNWFFLKERMCFDDLKRTPYHPVVDGNYLYRKTVFDQIAGYETDFGALESWSFGYKALISGYNYKIVSGTKYFHRVDGKSYWVRESKNNGNNMKRLLLKFPKCLSKEEIDRLNLEQNTQNALLTLPNDFVSEEINILFRVLLKLYYIKNELFKKN